MCGEEIRQLLRIIAAPVVELGGARLTARGRASNSYSLGSYSLGREQSAVFDHI